jgi:hypothetical protein
MAHRVEPAFAVLRGRREVDLDTALAVGDAWERQYVLPADEPADDAGVGRHSLEPSAVSGPTGEALVVRRHEFAVVQRQRPVRRVEKQRVVDRAALELVHAHGEPDARLAR